MLADFVAKTLDPLPGDKRVWAVGDRIQSRLADAGLAPVGLFAVPDVRGRHHAPRRPDPRGKRSRITKGPRAFNSISSTIAPGPARPTIPSVSTCFRSTHSGNSGWRVFPGRPRTCPRSSVITSRRCGTRTGVSFRFALQGVRRIAGSRKRQPPGRHAASREKHRRPGRRPESNLSPPAPDFDRRGVVRCHIRLRMLVQNEHSMTCEMTTRNTLIINSFAMTQSTTRFATSRRIPRTRSLRVGSPGLDRILTINGGSSSLKFAVYERTDETECLLSGRVDRIGLKDARWVVKWSGGGQDEDRPVDAPDQKSAIRLVIDWLETRRRVRQHRRCRTSHRSWRKSLL